MVQIEKKKKYIFSFNTHAAPTINAHSKFIRILTYISFLYLFGLDIFFFSLF